LEFPYDNDIQAFLQKLYIYVYLVPASSTFTVHHLKGPFQHYELDKIFDINNSLSLTGSYYRFKH